MFWRTKNQMEATKQSQIPMIPITNTKSNAIVNNPRSLRALPRSWERSNFTLDRRLRAIQLRRCPACAERSGIDNL